MNKLNRYLEVAQPWIPLGLFIVMLVSALGSLPYAQDDLLRNVTSYRWSFDYTKLFAYSPGVPSFNPYIGFDWLLSWPSRWWGPAAAVHLAQGLGLLAFTLVLWFAVPVQNRKAEPLTAATLVVFGSLVVSRLVSGRPEVWATVWALSSIALPRKAWLLSGALMAPLYWLMPMYAVGAFLRPNSSWKSMVLLCVGGAAASSVFWLGYAGLDWVSEGLALRHLGERPVQAEEALPVVNLFKYPSTWAVSFIAASCVALFCTRIKLLPLMWLPFVFFSITGGVRHILILAPIVALWLLQQEWKPRKYAFGLLFTFSLTAGIFASNQMPAKQVIGLPIPSGAAVLSAYNAAVFYLPHESAGFTIAPSIESGWDTSEVVSLAKAVKGGSLTCDQLKESSIKFTHVVGHKKALSGSCLELEASQGPWLLYRVSTHP